MSLAENYAVAGDEGVGESRPSQVGGGVDFPRVSAALLEELRALTSVAPTASDVLDELALALTVSSGVLAPRCTQGVGVGQVLTLRYLPERRSFANVASRGQASRLGHHSVLGMCRPGDVLVIDASGVTEFSVFGGMAALAASERGLGGCVIDGGVRDIAEIRQLGLAVWSRAVTPKTGKWRVEAVGINEAVMCGGVQVQPGDVMIGDDSGICFIPVEAADAAASRILEVARGEGAQFVTSGRC